MRKDFIANLVKEIMQLKQNDILLDDIFTIIKDILIFLEGRDTEEYKTKQHIVGISNLFREYAVKVQKGINFQQDKY